MPAIAVCTTGLQAVTSNLRAVAQAVAQRLVHRQGQIGVDAFYMAMKALLVADQALIELLGDVLHLQHHGL